MQRLALLALVCSAACLDFDAAKAKCVDEGRCLAQLAPPTVTMTTPANQATGVRPNTLFAVTFSKPMDKSATTKPSLSPPVVMTDLQWADDGLSYVVQPVVPLEFATTYTLTITGRAQDGAPMAEGGAVVSFSTASMPDTTAPTLTASTPSSGLTDVNVMTRLSLSFSEVMRPESLNVTTTPPLGLGLGTWSTDSRTVTFSAPLDDWAFNTTYIVQLEASDVAGNALGGTRSINFKTAAQVIVDTTPPTVLSTQPTAGAVGVDPRSPFSVVLSEPVTPASALQAFSITPAVSDCTPVLDLSGTQLGCSHATPLAADAGYTIRIGTELVDVAGNHLATPFTASFVSGSVPDTTRPTVVDYAPDAGSGLPTKPTFSITFSEPMDQATVLQALTLSTTNPVADVPISLVSWSTDGRTITVFSAMTLSYGASIRWQLGSMAADLVGNRLAAPVVFPTQFVRRLLGPVTLVPVATGGTTAGLASIGLYVGDNALNREQRAFMVFTLPSTALDITSATLNVAQSITAGSPFVGARVGVDAVPYTAPIDSTEASAQALCSGIRCGVLITCESVAITPLASASMITYPSVNVTGLASSGLGQPNKTFALRFKRVDSNPMVLGCPDIGSDNDNVGDYFRFFDPADATPANRPTLSITYTYP